MHKNQTGIQIYKADLYFLDFHNYRRLIKLKIRDSFQREEYLVNKQQIEMKETI